MLTSWTKLLAVLSLGSTTILGACASAVEPSPADGPASNGSPLADPAGGGTIDQRAWVIPEHLLRDYRSTYPGLTDTDIERRLSRLAVRKQLNEQWATANPQVFAGSSYDFVSDVLEVYATDPTLAGAIAAQAEQAGQSTATHVVSYGLQALEASLAALQSGAVPLPADAQIHIDIRSNRVVVGVDRIARAALSPAMLPPAVVFAAPETYPPAFPAACVSRYDCGAPLRSGVNVGPWNASTGRANDFCSLGFTASASDGSRWALTAGHCASQSAVDQAQIWAHGEQPIGPVRQRQDDGKTAVDVARIRFDSAYWRGAGGGFMYRTPTSTVDVDVAVISRSTIENGDPVCFDARSYAEGDDNCGVVTAAVGFRGMFTVSGVKICGGDSGGAAYLLLPNARWGYGLVNSTSQRGPDDCTSNGSVNASALPDINAWFDSHSAATIRVDTR